jgi:hypothetical protein
MSHRRLEEYSIAELEIQIEKLKEPFNHHCEYGGCHGVTKWVFDAGLGDHACMSCGITSEQDIMNHKGNLAMRGGY